MNKWYNSISNGVNVPFYAFAVWMHIYVHFPQNGCHASSDSSKPVVFVQGYVSPMRQQWSYVYRVVIYKYKFHHWQKYKYCLNEIRNLTLMNSAVHWSRKNVTVDVNIEVMFLSVSADGTQQPVVSKQDDVTASSIGAVYLLWWSTNTLT